MLLPRQKTTEIQSTLFPLETLITRASARNWCGDFFEEATSVATGAVRYCTDARVKVCPDLRWKQDRKIFFEVKSVGLTKHGIIYQNRWLKDLHWQKKNHCRIYYWFWQHQCSVKSCPDLIRLREGLAHTLNCLYVLPQSVLASLLANRPLKVLNTSMIRSGENSSKRLGYGKGNQLPTGTNLPYGFRSSSYGIGWSIPLTLVSKVCVQTTHLSLPFSVYGNVIHSLKVHSVNGETRKFLL